MLQITAKKIAAILLFMSVNFFSTEAAVASGADISARLGSGARKLVITLKSPSNLQCAGGLTIASSARRAKSNNTGLAQSFPSVSSAGTKFSINGLRPVRGRRSAAIFLSAKFTCDNGRSYSDLIQLLVPASTSSRAFRSAGEWISKARAQISLLFSQGGPTPTPGATPIAFPPASITLVEAFPSLSFDSPIDLRDANDSTGRLFVVEQGGKIRSFVNLSSSTGSIDFLDLTAKVKSGGEQGLLGLAFHPLFATNGNFYVNYTRAGDGATVISRFTALPGATQANLASEQILLTVAQPFDNHNGGAMQFGPDGFLYIGLGDGGSGGDPQGNGQKLTTLLGKILRIDVNRQDAGKNYGVPSSNPFVGQSGALPEIFAYGFRNPWRMSFDMATGRLWAGDVGQGAREEVDIVLSGRNYGWNKMEGKLCYPSNSTCNSALYESPVVDYARSLGQSITGGYVYRGSAVPALGGVYLYGDFVSGRIWGIRGLSPLENAPLLDTSRSISSFGIDRNGEVYLLDYSGKVYRFQ